MTDSQAEELETIMEADHYSTAELGSLARLWWPTLRAELHRLRRAPEPHGDRSTEAVDELRRLGKAVLVPAEALDTLRRENERLLNERLRRKADEAEYSRACTWDDWRAEKIARHAAEAQRDALLRVAQAARHWEWALHPDREGEEEDAEDRLLAALAAPEVQALLASPPSATEGRA